MIKFTLTIWVCSFLSAPSVCMAPIESPKLYNNWYECSRAAHYESIKIYSKIGYKMVDQAGLATRYTCRADEVI